MKNVLERLAITIKNEGFNYTILRVCRLIHQNYLRKHLPRRTIQMNGVQVRSGRAFDGLVPWETGHPSPENYEGGIVGSLEEYLKESDRVVIVGGGWGVTSTIAAITVGETGNVTTFEASPKYSRYVEETAELNGVKDRVGVNNAIVSHPVAVRGGGKTKNVIEATDLPECDVLELDCEGAETAILEDICITPRIIIVESHGHLNSSSDEVIKLLKANSYEIIGKELAEREGYPKQCRENDIYVITARRKQ